MTQIGVGIGVTKSPVKKPLDKQNHKADSTKTIRTDSQDILQRKKLNKQFSNNSSDPRHTNDGGDDENSNSFESHSDQDMNHPNDKKPHNPNNKIIYKTRRGMSVNWGSNSTTAINLTSTHQKHSSNVKSFAHSFYRSPIRISGLSASLSATKTKLKQPTNPTQLSMILTPIPSEPELSLCRIYPPPQPRPESLAIMSEELFHEKLKARQSPLLITTDRPQPPPAVVVNDDLPTTIVPIPLDKSPTEETHCSDQTLTKEKSEENLPEINSPSPRPHSQLTVKQIINHIDESSDESWRLLNSNSSLDIPYIDETDFEDLGKLFI